MDYAQFEGHTPGPWEEDDVTPGDYVGVRFDIMAPKPDGDPWPVRVCTTSDSVGINGQANARIIAAAPRLLEENKRMREALETIRRRISLQDTLADACALVVTRAASALGELGEGS